MVEEEVEREKKRLKGEGKKKTKRELTTAPQIYLWSDVVFVRKKDLLLKKEREKRKAKISKQSSILLRLLFFFLSVH
jgi:hypothetical protein